MYIGLSARVCGDRGKLTNKQSHSRSVCPNTGGVETSHQPTWGREQGACNCTYRGAPPFAVHPTHSEGVYIDTDTDVRLHSFLSAARTIGSHLIELGGISAQKYTDFGSVRFERP